MFVVESGRGFDIRSDSVKLKCIQGFYFDWWQFKVSVVTREVPDPELRLSV
jgi:hypothetical protein